MIEIKDIKVKDDNKINIDDLNIYLPFRLIINGSSGSGKSLVAYNIVKHLDKYFKKIYIICPSEDEKIKLLVKDEDDYYTSPSWETLEDIIYKTKQLKEDYEEELRIYNKYELIRKKRVNLLDDDELYFLDHLEQNGNLPPSKPDKNYHSLLLLDDVLGTPILQKKSPLNRWYVISRHYGQCIMILNQHFFSIPKVIRSNTNLFILFSTKDKKNLQAISDEVSGLVSYEQFKDIFNFSTNEPYSFLFINLQKNEFRKNLNHIINYK